MLEQVKDVSIVLAGLIALITFVKGTLEFAQRGRQERAETFVQMRRRFLESPIFNECLPLLQSDDPALARLPVQDRRSFLGFFEEVALMVNSGLLKPPVASYMFGYYVDLCARSVHFWEGLDPDSRYWTLFRNFAVQMKDIESRTDVSSGTMAF
ncbi:MAG: hypothetical protein JST30_14785 [Armatimonadetes bacterium]|nr:hypothetical protein [Armatimonadota bacterium]